MLQKSPVLTPSLENLSYILRHREWWPEGFEWDFRCYGTCALGLSEALWDQTVASLNNETFFQNMDTIEEYDRIFTTPAGKAAIWRYFRGRDYAMKSVTSEQVADQIDQYLASR
jgi:hypothetical protein